MTGISAYISGAWKPAKGIWVYIGAWKPVSNIWVYIGGAWKLAYSAIAISLSPTSATLHTSGTYVGFNFGGSSNIGVLNTTATITGGAAPITLTASKKSGPHSPDFTYATCTYNSGVTGYIIFDPTTAGAYVITITATDANGATASADVSVTVIDP